MLPAGDTIAWAPVTAPNPTTQPGQPGDIVLVSANDISGYTWSIVRGSDGTNSGTCGGMPNNGGTCVGLPQQVSYSQWA